MTPYVVGFVISFIAGATITAIGLRLEHGPKHRHQYLRVGYGGAGWSVLRCSCGATEVDA